jgi:DNA polymerase-3 subunit beta
MGMKFRCERDALLDALNVAVRAAAGASSSRAALTGAHLDLMGGTLVVTGSDLDLTLSVTTEVAGEADGAAVTPARLLTDVVRAVPAGSVEFSVTDDGEALIVAGSSEFSIRLIPEEDYPQLAFKDEATDEGASSVAFSPAVTFDGPEFREALSQVVRSASSDDSRPILTGVLMAAEDDGQLRLVSTDSYRLSVRDLEGSSILGEHQRVLVPSRALGELQRLIADSGDVTLKLAEHYAQFVVGAVQLTTRLIPGDFPNYQGLIPADHPNCMTANREQLLEVVRRVRLLAQDSTPVRLVMSSENLEVIAITHDVGKANESMNAQYEGEDLTVAFNPGYLIDGIEAATGDEITLHTADSVKPALIRSVGDDGFLYLLMPVRVS